VKGTRLGLVLTTIAIPLIIATFYSIVSASLQVFGQLNNSKAPHDYSNNDLVNLTTIKQKIVHRGIVSSEEFKGVTSQPGDALQGAAILTNNPDASIYSGIITFTSTKPVEVGISHRLHIDNAAYLPFNTRVIGEFYAGFHNSTGERGTPDVISVPSVIIPNYGTAPPYFSASINFVGDSLWLRSLHGEPVIGVYNVVADIVKPKGVVDVDSALVSHTNAKNSDN